MARRIVTTTEYTDDLDGGSAEQTVAFAYDGTDYEIDLNADNAHAFAEAMALYVAHARKITGRGRVRRSAGASRQDLGDVRAWAADQGYDVAPRGRVAGEILDAYDAAH